MAVVDVIANDVELELFRPTSGDGKQITFKPAACGGAQLTALGPSQSGTSNISALPIDELRVGETLIIQITAPEWNTSPSSAEAVTAVITAASGDTETIQIEETGHNTGVFTGAIQTRPIPAPASSGDCLISLRTGDAVSVAIKADENAPSLAAATLPVLTGPYDITFDSATGAPISGVRVTIIDAATGQPANVLGMDSITTWPSSVITGQPVTDSAGNIVAMEAGEYRFPAIAAGTYRLRVEPPAPFTAPSTAPASQLANLRREAGTRFAVSDGSYGKEFTVSADMLPHIDIPLDQPAANLVMEKTASRSRAQAGDAIIYTVTIRNPSVDAAADAATLTNLVAPAMRLRSDSIFVGGIAAKNVANISSDGRQFALNLPSLSPSQSITITYAAAVRANASSGQALNRASLRNPQGTEIGAEAVVQIERETIPSRMTIIGRITAGPCSLIEARTGIAGVRVMLQDGSFAITDEDGRYHFEGFVPGSHVIQAQRQTLPEGGAFVDCAQSVRSAGSASSRFVNGQGGSLIVQDFHAAIANIEGNSTTSKTTPEASALSDRIAAGADTNWIASGDGPDGFLFPLIDHNPRAPAVRVVVRHRISQRVTLFANGKPVSDLNLDRVQKSPDGRFAVTIWRGVPLQNDSNHLVAKLRNSDGTLAKQFEREVAFTSVAWSADILPEHSRLEADGKTRPVIAVRLTDRRGRPIRQGVTGAITISEPYESAELLDQMQLAPLANSGNRTASWRVQDDDGVALIELAPTMVSGRIQLGFDFTDKEATREQLLESWIVPGDLEWTIIGLAEASAGAKSIADNMERSGSFDSDFGNNTRLALYARGKILGRFIMTLAYDSAKQEADQRLLGAIDPNAYYTVYGDHSDRRYDAASCENLYLRIETHAFYALYGDFSTGFEQTELARYNRTTTGVQAEGQFGKFYVHGFAANVETRFRRDEIQGSGLSGPYRLGRRNIVANSESIAIEVRDRFRSEVIISRRELTRFIDYDIDIFAGTIRFKQPILSRDAGLNPQFIIASYEVYGGSGAASLNAGIRAHYTLGDDLLRIGLTGISDKGDGARTQLAALDLRARLGHATELRAEIGVSDTVNQRSSGWLLEAEHRSGSLDLLAYVRSADAQFGTGQQSSAELGRRKFGVDARYAIDDDFSLSAAAWIDNSLSDGNSRRAAQIDAVVQRSDGDARVGLAHFSDRLANGASGDSTTFEASATKRLLGNRFEIGAATSFALDNPDANELPNRHQLRASYRLANWMRILGTYEIASNNTLTAKTANVGVQFDPWQGSQISTAIGQSVIAEQGKRAFAAFGLSQTFPISGNLSIDATVDGNRMIGSTEGFAAIKPGQSAATGGSLSQDGVLFENFTAVTLGAAWRKEAWAANVRGEYRHGDTGSRRGLSSGLIRQLGDGIVIGSGFTWTKASASNGSTTQIFDGAVAAAYRPSESETAFLGKLEFRSDAVTNAVAGETTGAGRTALKVTGNAKSQRMIASLSADWSPRSVVDGKIVQRGGIGLFIAGRHNFDRVENFDLAATTLLAGLDVRIGVAINVELGVRGTVRANVDDGAASFAIGPHITVSPAKDTAITLGYNVTGFRDPEFSAARNTDAGVFISARIKFDPDSFGFLGLRR
ncbi:MAG: hypothetical protein ABJ195_11085 [Marinomonas sp.]